MKEGMYDLAVFSIEQALQLFLKAKLLEDGVDYPKKHSIRRLLNMLAEVGPEHIDNKIREMMNKYIFEFGVFEDAYISSRYTLREYLKEEVKRLRELAEEVVMETDNSP